MVLGRIAQFAKCENDNFCVFFVFFFAAGRELGSDRVLAASWRGRVSTRRMVARRCVAGCFADV